MLFYAESQSITLLPTTMHFLELSIKQRNNTGRLYNVYAVGAAQHHYTGRQRRSSLQYRHSPLQPRGLDHRLRLLDVRRWICPTGSQLQLIRKDQKMCHVILHAFVGGP